jgi:hypothetical protein
MSRTPNASDFHVDVDGIGRFAFGRRTINDTYKIRAAYARLTDGNYDEDGNVGDISAIALVTIRVLLVAQPDGFDIEMLDPLLDDKWEEKIMKVWTALRDKELSFRPKPTQAGEGSGEAASQ